MTAKNVKALLDKALVTFNNPAFIENDPILIPHLFSKKQNREISGLFAAIFAWGQRKTIISKSKELMERMDNSPYSFITGHSVSDLKNLIGFRHRTFNDTDLLYIVSFLKKHYRDHSSLEDAFLSGPADNIKVPGKHLITFHNNFFSLPEFPERTRKHIPTPLRNSSCKRLNMFLRWMVRNDDKGVDLGIWKKISPAELICPLDVHVTRSALKLGLLERTIPDFKACMELTRNLCKMDPADPVKYDFALFGMGIHPDYLH